MHSRLAQTLFCFAFVLLLPATAQACTCVITGPADRPPILPLPLEQRAVVFVGNAIEVGSPIDSSGSYVVRFVTELSWRGAMPDTVSLLVAGAPCVHFARGARYFVGAEPDSTQPTRLRTRPCDEAHEVSRERSRARIDALGVPVWRAPPIAERDIGKNAVQLGATLRPHPFPDAVVFFPAFRGSVESFEIGDVRVRGHETARMVSLELGKLYRFRLTWPSGIVYDSVLLAQCAPMDAGRDPCILGLMLPHPFPAL